MRQIVVTQTGTGSSATVPLDIHGRPEVSLQIDATGTVNYTVQQTLDNVFDSTITPVWFDHPDTNLVSQTVDRQGNYAYIPAAVRVTVNSGTGSARLTVIQAGLARA